MINDPHELEKLQRKGSKYHDGLNRQARNPVRLPDGSGDLASAGGIARDDIIDHRRQVGTPRDVTPAHQPTTENTGK
jgi:hypothetical protein